MANFQTQCILDEHLPEVLKKAFSLREHHAFQSRLAYGKVLSQASIQNSLAGLAFPKQMQKHGHSFLKRKESRIAHIQICAITHLPADMVTKGTLTFVPT